MDTHSSGEDLVVKARKPYVITKQRERWTEKEHNRFLEALKLYGRAWQRIEEHIGTKTAVQIRSHAQKFFSKLEKEAIAKGVPVGQNLDIDIPPPRPKRKPSNPYPRKMGASPTASQVGAKKSKLFNSVSFQHGKQALDLEKEPLPEKSIGDEKPTHAKENQDENCSGLFTLLKETPCSSLTLVNKNSTTMEVLRKSCSSQEFVSLKEIVNTNAIQESFLTIQVEEKQKLDIAEEAVQDNGTVKDLKLENSCLLHENKLVQGNKSHDLAMASPADDLQTMQNNPKHVHVHVLDVSLGPCMQTSSDLTFQECVLPMGTAHLHPNAYSHPAASNTAEHQSNTLQSSTHQSHATFPPPFNTAPPNQNDCRSFLQLSSTFSNLIMSTLMQNPAAHAAASFAATFWPYANLVSSADSPTSAQGGSLCRQINSAPSMADIAAATVAAATSWWAAHGLLPLCAPPYAAFTCPPASAGAVPVADTGEIPENKQERGETTPDNPLQDQDLEPEHSDTLPAQNSAAKSQTTSSADSEEIGGPKVHKGSSIAAHENAAAAAPEAHDSSKTKGRKQVDRSSCGSNTPSSSEVETDALEKHEKGTEEPKENDANHLAAETTNRRSRTCSSTSDSWKEVSEEGRLAFQALFSREVLPQSFSPPQDKACQNTNDENDKEVANLKDGDVSMLYLNSKTSPSCSCRLEMEENASHRFESNGEEGLLTIGLGHGKLKARRTGFKPYKRCSVEAKESKMVTPSSQGEEKGPKRIRLEGEASI